MSTATDRIVLTVPGSIELRSTVSLVLGGIASRSDLPYDKVDELQLAVLTVLGAFDVDSATVEVEVEDTLVRVHVGPLPAGTMTAAGLHSVLERLVDAVSSSTRDDGDWIVFELARPRST